MARLNGKVPLNWDDKRCPTASACGRDGRSVGSAAIAASGHDRSRVFSDLACAIADGARVISDSGDRRPAGVGIRLDAKEAIPGACGTPAIRAGSRATVIAWHRNPGPETGRHVGQRQPLSPHGA